MPLGNLAILNSHVKDAEESLSNLNTHARNALKGVEESLSNLNTYARNALAELQKNMEVKYVRGD